mgnify:CR=1 FL=1|jgi:Alw26I/Eco31I/Esp3I family type II restriction m6 adenine DNA methyltransferase
MATYNKETFKRLFQSKFNLSKWQMLLQDYFHADKVRVSPEALDEDAEDRKGYFLGSMTTRDNYELGFFYYEMEDGSVLRRKVGLRNLIRPYLGYGFDAALAVFNDGINWRLSLICDLKEDATSTKRFTYVFGDEKAYYKTPVSRFVDLQKKANEFLEIKKAFSVEALSDDFFAAYRKQYAEFVKFLTGKEYVKKGNKWMEQETGEPDVQYFTSFKEDDKLVRDYIKKMMGRIVFLYFLQSKGWLAGNLHYMHDLFYDASDEVKEDFLDKVLEPMFFGLLNTKPEDRSSAPLVNGVGVKYIPNADEIPYLNGGLFQQEKIDEVDSVFPAGMFQSLFDFFDSYNFTIDENDPNDAEVGVDPEMLGKIFENLLEDNKDKGAFYTPKEIVRYMCQESLTAYLQTGIEDAEVKEHIANFVKTNDVEELGGASSELAMSIDRKLIDVKICDPAIGSGAFPMGLLRELYACRKSIEIFEEDNAADIKRHIIQNNIYGVDIEKGAVDIARLRFWLALIIDEKEPMPLPNLDFKIMQGNSLLESYKGVDLDVTSKKLKTGKDTKKTRGVLSLGFEETDVQKTIQDLVKSYFSITDHTLRAQRRQQIDKYVKDYIKVCAEGNHEVQDAVDELEIPNDQFFLWHTYFADVFEQGGFDIVIGNPPYNEVRDLDKELQESYKKSLFYAQAKGGRLNLFQFFYPLSLYILKSYGICSFITQNSILAEESAIGNRKMIFSDSLVLKVDSFPERDNVRLRVFESVKMSVAILLIRKQTNIVDQTFHVNVWKDKFMSSKSILKISKQEIMQVYPNDLVIPICDNIRWNILSKMRRVGIFSINAQAGEIDMTKYKSNFSQDKIAYRVVTGAQVLRYRLTDTPSQGSVLYLKKADLSESRYAAFEQERIVMQRITGVDSKIRIIATMLPKCTYCANSTNYISGCSNQIDLLYLLGVLNSKSINFFFKQTSTNTNVTSKEIAKFPILVNVNSISVITKLVKEILDLKQRMFDTSALENQIDFLVYHLYGLTYDEVLIVDPETPISREEYEAYKEK